MCLMRQVTFCDLAVGIIRRCASPEAGELSYRDHSSQRPLEAVKRDSVPAEGDMRRNADEWNLIVRQYVVFCFRNASVPRVDELASILSMSREGFTRTFHAATGRSPAAVIHAMQLRRAKALLASSDQSTSDIAKAAAYGSVRAFYRAFRRYAGVTPTAYRLRIRRRQ